MARAICVYSSSSCAIDEKYFRAAAELGREMGKRKYELIFGAGTVGLMGATAKALHEEGGRVVGVIPEALNIKGIVYDTCDEIFVTKGLRERKAIMDERADAFIALPGGFGTLEELLEIITLKQLGYHDKPIVVLNVGGFYDDLVELFEKIIREKFAKPQSRNLYYVTGDVYDALNYIESYQGYTREDKWFADAYKESVISGEDK